MIANSNNPEQAIVNALKPANPNLSNEALATFADEEKSTYDFLIEEISKKAEVRSRM